MNDAHQLSRRQPVEFARARIALLGSAPFPGALFTNADYSRRERARDA